MLGCGKAPGPQTAAEAAKPAAVAAQKPLATPQGEMVAIPAGEFMMGDDAGDADEKPAHKVTVGAFLMDVREVTQKSYENLIQKNPAKFTGPDRPVERVDWYHAVLYCNMRSLKEGLKACYDPKTLACDFSANGYRLPTEAEWEYACRAGSAGRYSFGGDPAQLKNNAWCKANSERKTHPVGQKPPNAWGLYDMHGNVAEWCHDVYAADYYPKKEGDNPRGPAAGDKRVLRGGGWNSGEDGCRASARASENARCADSCFGSDAFGFRCVRVASNVK